MVRIRDYVKPYGWKMAGIMTLKMLGTLSELFLPWALAHIINKVVPTKSIEQIVTWGIIMVVSAIIAVICSVLANRLASKVSSCCIRSIRHDLFKKIMSLSSAQMDKVTIPSAISRLTSDSYNVHRGIDTIQRMAVRAPILLIGGTILTLTIDPFLSLVLIILLPIVGCFSFFITRKGIPLFVSLQKAVDSLVENIRQGVTGIRIIKALSKVDYEKEKFDKTNKEVVKRQTKSTLIMGLTNPIMNLILNMGLVAVIIVGAYRVNEGLSQAGSIIAFMNYFIIILNAIMTVSRIFVTLTQSTASSKRICEILNLKKDLVVEQLPEVNTDYHIIFDDVSFSYLKRTDNVKNISFKLKRGQTLGIIGPTGSGKSTIINLLTRLYDTDSGTIYIDGKNIKSIQPEELHKMFGVAFQNDILFAESIYENIAFGRELTSEEIEFASCYAQATDFIDSLNDRFRHNLTIKGSNLSGGQKQRLIISRALASEPDILVLDDSSSALDYKTDSRLRQAISKNYKDTTSVIIAQRISSIKNCDYIMVLDEGHIIGYGTHDELMNSCPQYQLIAENQMGLQKVGAK